MRRNTTKTAGTFLVGLAGLLGALVLVAGPAGALESGTAHADDNSVASGNAVAIDGSTASGDAVAVHGSTASGCSVATNHSTASGAQDPCPLAAAPTPKHDHHVDKVVVHKAPHAHGVPARSLAVTGSEVVPLSAIAALAVVLGLAMVRASGRRQIEASA